MFSARYTRTQESKRIPELIPAGDVDYSIEVRRLRKNLLTLVEITCTATLAQSSATIANIVRQQGWRSEDLVIVPVHAFDLDFHIVTVPASSWRKERERLADLKHLAVAAGEKVLLMSPSYIQREPRLTNLNLLAGASEISVSCEDRMAVFMCIMEHGGFSTFQDCACALPGSATPFSSVLAMAGLGLVIIDLNKPLTPASRVSLPAEASWT